MAEAPGGPNRGRFRGWRRPACPQGLLILGWGEAVLLPPPKKGAHLLPFPEPEALPHCLPHDPREESGTRDAVLSGTHSFISQNVKRLVMIESCRFQPARERRRPGQTGSSSREDTSVSGSYPSIPNRGLAREKSHARPPSGAVPSPLLPGLKTHRDLKAT